MKFEARYIHGEYESEFFEIRQKVYKALDDYNEYKNTSGHYEHDPIKQEILRCISDNFDESECEIVLTGYSQTEGSLIVEFSVLAVIYGGFLSYGAFRQSLDFFKRDIKLIERPIREIHNIILSVKAEKTGQKGHTRTAYEEQALTASDKHFPAKESTTGFSLREIILILTIVNIVLFFGGTIWSGIRISTIEEQYNEALKIVRDAESELTNAEYTLSKLKREAFNAEYEIKEAIEQHVSDVGKTNVKKIDELATSIIKDLEKLETKPGSIAAKTKELELSIERFRQIQEQAETTIKGYSERIERLKSLEQSVTENGRYKFTGMLAYYWSQGDILIRTLIFIYLALAVGIVVIVMVFVGNILINIVRK